MEAATADAAVVVRRHAAARTIVGGLVDRHCPINGL